jgi:hypothetical protein
MLDMAESFFNAWLTQMGQSNMRLFCAWHGGKINGTDSDVGWVNTQWVGKYFLGIYPRPG